MKKKLHSARLPEEIIAKLDDVSHLTGIPRSEFIERIAEMECSQLSETIKLEVAKQGFYPVKLSASELGIILNEILSRVPLYQRLGVKIRNFNDGIEWEIFTSSVNNDDNNPVLTFTINRNWEISSLYNHTSEKIIGFNNLWSIHNILLKRIKEDNFKCTPMEELISGDEFIQVYCVENKLL